MAADELDNERARVDKKRVPFKPGFLTENLEDLTKVRLTGSRCNVCGIALLGKRRRCENCTSLDLNDIVFGSLGKVYSYTIQRFAPPSPHAGPNPWVPRALAWVDIECGARILAPVTTSSEQMAIGMTLRLVCEVGWTDKTNQEVITYRFVPAINPED